MDGFGETLQLRKSAVVGGVAGMTTSGFVSRDILGRAVRTYHPFFTAGESTAFASPVATPFKQVTYDTMDRPTTTTHPDGATESVAFEIAAEPGTGTLLFWTRSTDANGNIRETYADELDRVRTFIEYPTSSAPSINRYDYLPTGELSRIVDADQNQSTLTYDLRGLRTTLNNPDTGLVEEQFDLMGNRIALVEPNHRALNTRVRFRYERDRLVGIDYPSKTDVSFVYGPPGASRFGAGRIMEVHDETGKQEHSFGALGETRRTVRTVVDPSKPSHDPIVFDTRQTHDSLGRQLRTIYPDGEIVTNTYDAGGQLVQVTGAGATYTRIYASELQYDVFGNRTRMRFGNGVVSTWRFDPLRVRLTNVVTTLPTSEKVQDLRYTYDPGSNPTRIQNVLPPSPSNNTLPGSSDVTYTYDGVDRLLHASGTASLGGNKTTTYEQAFSFGPSHRLTQKSLVHTTHATAPPATNYSFAYHYDASRPHSPSRVGKLDVVYDPSGNPTTRTKTDTGSVQTLTWDDDGRLVEANISSSNQRNFYDASGLRVLRSSAQGTTIFASNLFDFENNGTGSKHIFAGAVKVAVVLSEFSGGEFQQPPVRTGSEFYFHHDHLGSTAVVSGSTGAVNDAHEYFSDGELWINTGAKKPVNGYLFSGKQLDPDTGFYED